MVVTRNASAASGYAVGTGCETGDAAGLLRSDGDWKRVESDANSQLPCGSPCVSRRDRQRTGGRLILTVKDVSARPSSRSSKSLARYPFRARPSPSDRKLTRSRPTAPSGIGCAIAKSSRVQEPRLGSEKNEK